MARARNIKPAFFTNDDLADIDPLGRLFFIGLWTICDYKGDIEWRERRIKAQILPYDNCNILELAINLDKSGFIRFYSVQDNLYLNVVNFAKHQNPHINEKKKGSEIPEYSEKARQDIEIKGVTINLDKSGSKPEQNSTDPADSLILNPESFNLNPDTSEEDSLPDKSDAKDVIDYMNAVLSTKFKATTKSHIENINGRLSDGHSVEELKLVIDHKYREWSDDQRMAGYLRPGTLFSASKFQGYLLAAKTKPKTNISDVSNIKYTSGNF